jgi:hypothetical protein
MDHGVQVIPRLHCSIHCRELLPPQFQLTLSKCTGKSRLKLQTQIAAMDELKLMDIIVG